MLFFPSSTPTLPPTYYFFFYFFVPLPGAHKPKRCLHADVSSGGGEPAAACFQGGGQSVAPLLFMFPFFFLLRW